MKELKHRKCYDRQIPFLTEGEDQARSYVASGKSELSGEYIIEESKARGQDGSECAYRRLIFKNQPTLVQSECKVKMEFERVKKGKKKITVRNTSLRIEALLFSETEKDIRQELRRF